MVYIIVACAFFSISNAAFIPEEGKAKTTSFENTNDGTGNYRFRFLTSKGINRKETGRVVNVDKKDEHIVIEGSYSYTDPDGNTVQVRYSADENGYHIVNPAYVSAVPPQVVASLLGK